MSLARNAGLLLVAVGMVGCVTQHDLKEIKENQKTIISKLEAIEKKGPAQPARPQRPRGPDPKAVYSMAVGESYTKGPKDAWVTLVEI